MRWRQLNGRLVLCMDVWLQTKVRERGNGLRSRLYTGFVCAAQRSCSCSMPLAMPLSLPLICSSRLGVCCHCSGDAGGGRLLLRLSVQDLLETAQGPHFPEGTEKCRGSAERSNTRQHP